MVDRSAERGAGRAVAEERVHHRRRVVDWVHADAEDDTDDDEEDGETDGGASG